jgi:uncharacterized protein (DUF433 family)
MTGGSRRTKGPGAAPPFGSSPARRARSKAFSRPPSSRPSAAKLFQAVAREVFERHRNGGLSRSRHGIDELFIDAAIAGGQVQAVDNGLKLRAGELLEYGAFRGHPASDRTRGPASRSRLPKGSAGSGRKPPRASCHVSGCPGGYAGGAYPPLVGPFDRITSDPAQMNGQPCVRGLRLTVRRVLESLATYPDQADLLREYPELEPEDIPQVLGYAATALHDKVIELSRRA